MKTPIIRLTEKDGNVLIVFTNHIVAINRTNNHKEIEVHLSNGKTVISETSEKEILDLLGLNKELAL